MMTGMEFRYQRETNQRHSARWPVAYGRHSRVHVGGRTALSSDRQTSRSKADIAQRSKTEAGGIRNKIARTAWDADRSFLAFR